MANNPEMLTERELEEVTAVFKSFETGMREATIHPKVYPPMLGHDKKTKLCIRVSHFYTFFELSLVLLTTQAKSAHFRTKKMALRVAKSKF